MGMSGTGWMYAHHMSVLLSQWHLESCLSWPRVFIRYRALQHWLVNDWCTKFKTKLARQYAGCFSQLRNSVRLCVHSAILFDVAYIPWLCLVADWECHHSEQRFTCRLGGRKPTHPDKSPTHTRHFAQVCLSIIFRYWQKFILHISECAKTHPKQCRIKIIITIKG